MSVSVHLRRCLTVHSAIMVLLCRGAQRLYTLADKVLIEDGQQEEAKRS